MNNSGEIFAAIFFFIDGLAFIGLGLISLRYDMGFIEVFRIPFVSSRYKNRCLSKEKKMEMKKKVDRYIGCTFIAFGCIAIITGFALFFTII